MRRRAELWVRVANVAALVCVVLAAIGWVFPSTIFAVPFALFFLLSSWSWRDGLGTRRTETGR